MLGFRPKPHSGKKADIPAIEPTFRQKPVSSRWAEVFLRLSDYWRLWKPSSPEDKPLFQKNKQKSYAKPAFRFERVFGRRH